MEKLKYTDEAFVDSTIGTHSYYIKHLKGFFTGDLKLQPVLLILEASNFLLKEQNSLSYITIHQVERFW